MVLCVCVYVYLGGFKRPLSCSQDSVRMGWVLGASLRVRTQGMRAGVLAKSRLSFGCSFSLDLGFQGVPTSEVRTVFVCFKRGVHHRTGKRGGNDSTSLSSPHVLPLL